jgi:membrane dipeptidase
MIIADGHLDLGYNALQCNRNILNSVLTIRVQEVGMGHYLPPNWGATQGTVALPEMRRGRVALSFVTLIAASSGHMVPHMDYPSQLQANAIARGQLAYYRLLEKEGFARVITNGQALHKHIVEWEVWDGIPNAAPETAPPLGFVISMEGSDPVLRPEELEEWYELGLRMIIVAHYGLGRYSGGTGTELGLTQIGFSLLNEMECLGILLDVTHFSDQAFWQALDNYRGTILASHSNSRVLVPSQRQFSDEQIKAIIERGGVIGTCADIWMLQPNWVLGVDSNKDVSIQRMVDHIDHVCQLAGNSYHAAIGTDLDGGYGQKQCPYDLETIADLQKLNGILDQHGYSADDRANVLYRNWVRLLEKSWGKNKR